MAGMSDLTRNGVFSKCFEEYTSHGRRNGAELGAVPFMALGFLGKCPRSKEVVQNAPLPLRSAPLPLVVRRDLNGGIIAMHPTV